LNYEIAAQNFSFQILLVNSSDELPIFNFHVWSDNLRHPAGTRPGTGTASPPAARHPQPQKTMDAGRRRPLSRERGGRRRRRWAADDVSATRNATPTSPFMFATQYYLSLIFSDKIMFDASAVGKSQAKRDDVDDVCVSRQRKLIDDGGGVACTPCHNISQ
jgi:hypothetical protein